MAIASGRRRHVLTISNPGEMVPDGGGGWTETPAVLGQVYGEIVPASVRDLERSMPNIVIASASHIVTIPYVAGVTLVSTVVFHDTGGDRTFSIAGISDPEERHVELVLACEEAL
jgi:head-tail adaptor